MDGGGRRDTIRGDVNCRNFLLADDGILYGVDFETLPEGKRETDVGVLCAYILTYDPARSPLKKQMAEELIALAAKKLSLNEKALRGELRLALEDTALRREHKDVRL